MIRLPPGLVAAWRRRGSRRLPEAPPGDRAVWIDRPIAGTALRESVLKVEGWALFPSGMAARVEVRLDGELLGLARLAVPRPDVGAAYGLPDAAIAGWELEACVGGTGTSWLTVTCHGANGEVATSAPVFLRLAPPPVLPAARAGGGRRLLAVTHQLDLGGGQLYLHDLLGGLVLRHGYQVTLLSLGDGVLRQRCEELGMAVEVIGGWGQKVAADYEARQAELVAWAAGRVFDAALVNTMGAFGGADLAGRLGLPCLWAIHESFPLPLFWWAAYGPDGIARAVKARAEEALRRGTLLFETEATRALFAPRAAAERRLLIPYGIYIREIDAFVAGCDRAGLRTRLGIAPDELVILCVGTVQPRKGQNLLLRAFEDCAAAASRARLVFIGDLGDGYGAALRHRAAQSAVADRVRVVPVVENIYDWYATGDLLVCASDVESMPRSVLEAMAFELPVLATDVFGLPELVEDGVTGYLCRHNDRLSLAAALRRALADTPRRRRELAAAARARVCERHEAGGFVDACAALLDRLCGGELAAAGATAAAAPRPADHRPVETPSRRGERG